MKALKILFSGIVLLWLAIQVMGCIPPPGYYGHPHHHGGYGHGHGGYGHGGHRR